MLYRYPLWIEKFQAVSTKQYLLGVLFKISDYRLRPPIWESLPPPTPQHTRTHTAPRNYVRWEVGESFYYVTRVKKGSGWVRTMEKIGPWSGFSSGAANANALARAN